MVDELSQDEQDRIDDWCDEGIELIRTGALPVTRVCANCLMVTVVMTTKQGQTTGKTMCSLASCQVNRNMTGCRFHQYLGEG